MRTLSSTLTQAQKDMGAVLCKIVLTSGANSYTYGVDTSNLLLKVTHSEQSDSQTAKVTIDNSDGTLTSLSLEGYQGVLSYGYTTSAGDEYSATAPLKVKAQELLSTGGVLTCQLTLFGLPDQLDEDKASQDYAPDSTNTDTVKTIISAILGATLACYNHTTAITVTYDSEDSLIDTFQPKDTFRIYTGQSRLEKIKRLLSFTKCVMRSGADGAIHILSPTVSGVTYDYQYDDTVLSSNHTFFAKTYRNVLVLPNRVIVKDAATSPTYAGTATSSTSFALLPKTDFEILAVANTAQATAVATAMIQKAEQANEKGSGFVPMNVGQEVFDYIKITDTRENDNRVGNVGYITRTFDIIGRSFPFSMGFGFGSILLGGSIGLTTGATGRTPDSTVSYAEFTNFAEQMYSNFETISVYLENLGHQTIWIDDTVPDTLDDVPDGTTYKRVLATAITAGNIRLSEVIGNLDDVDEGATYGRLRTTNLSAGYIKLTSDVVASGKWYDSSGVEISASSGINIYGTNNALVTRASQTSTIQCSVNSSGQILAGAGNVILDASGLTISGTVSSLVSFVSGTTSHGNIYTFGDGIAIISANTKKVSIGQGTEYTGSAGIGIVGRINYDVEVITSGTGRFLLNGSAITTGGLGNIVEDLTPQLGGDLDPNGKKVIGDFLPSGTTYNLGQAGSSWSNIVGGYIVANGAGLAANSIGPYSGSTLIITNMRTAASTYASTARVIDTTYTNSTGKPLAIFGSITIYDTHDVYFKIAATADPPGTTVVHIQNNGGAVGIFPCSGIVPVGWKYRMSKTTGANDAIDEWHEVELG